MTGAERLKLTCQACGHATSYERGDAWRIFGMGATPFAIRRRAKCIQCGERTLIAVAIS